MRLTRNEALLLGLVALIVFLCGLLPVGLMWGLGGMGGFGMMGPGWIGPGMMGGMGLFWLLILALPLLVLVVIVVVLATRRDNPPVVPGDARCPQCSRSVQLDWKVCPYCGEHLNREEN